MRPIYRKTRITAQQRATSNEEMMMGHSDTELITRLAAELAKQIQVRPAIPVEIDLWDIATIAAWMKRSEAVVRERMACLPDFPKAIRPPSTRAVRGQPLYYAREVIAWAEKYKDRN